MYTEKHELAGFFFKLPSSQKKSVGLKKFQAQLSVKKVMQDSLLEQEKITIDFLEKWTTLFSIVNPYIYIYIYIYIWGGDMQKCTDK